MNRAVEYYTQTPKIYNCAQAVVAGAGRMDLVEEMKACGAGRSPEGRCGALHAALVLLPADKQEIAKQIFKETAQSEFCRVLKQEVHFPCQDCVALAAKILDQYTQD